MPKLRIERTPDGDHEYIECPSVVTGSYAGRKYVNSYSQLYWRNEERPDGWTPSEYIWSDGNWACDCNRIAALGIKAEDHPELFDLPGQMYRDGSGPHEGEPEPRCGHAVLIERIDLQHPDAEAIGLKPLILDEIDA